MMYALCTALECPNPQMEYKVLTRACPATCEDPKAAEKCHLADTEACECPEGTLLQMDKCISPNDCGCMDSQGNIHTVGVIMISNNLGWVQKIECILDELGCVTESEAEGFGSLLINY